MNHKQMDLLVVGELNVDLIMDGISAPPEVGKEQIAEEMTLTLGSSSAIFASNSASLGSSVAFAGWIGRDSFGQLVVDSLGESGVDTGYVVKRQEHRTGVTVAFNIDQERMMVTHPGAMEQMSVDDLPLDEFDRFRHLHVSSAFLQPALKPGLPRLFERARKAGLTTSLDPQWDPAEEWDLDLADLLPHLTWFLPNESELFGLTGTASLDQALDQLPARRGEIVVKRGTEGSVLLTPEGDLLRQPACRMDSFGDAIGAGDSFDAGFIRAMLDGRTQEEALRFGNLCGAVSTTASGGTAAIRSREQVIEIGITTGYYNE